MIFHLPAVTCENPEGEAPLISQCSHPLNQLQPGATCSFQCEAGFDLKGASTILCSEEGRWNKATPSCKGVEIWYKPDIKILLFFKFPEQFKAAVGHKNLIICCNNIISSSSPQNGSVLCSKLLRMAKSTAPAVNQPTTQNASFHAILSMHYMDMGGWSVIATATGQERSLFVKVKTVWFWIFKKIQFVDF